MRHRCEVNLPTFPLAPNPLKELIRHNKSASASIDTSLVAEGTTDVK